MKRPVRYHPILVVIHWLSVFLVILMLLVGMFLLKQMPNTEAKIPFLAVHMTTGIAILLLTIVRLVVRFATKLPAPARSDSMFLDGVARLTHVLLYLVTIAMSLAGMGTASQAGLMEIVFGESGAPLPEDFFAFPARYGHGYLALGLLALVGLHVAAAFYHQFLRKDNLMARMSLGRQKTKRKNKPSP